MDASELKMRCIEAAVRSPAAALGAGSTAENIRSAAQLWYTFVVGNRPEHVVPPKSDNTLRVPNKK